MQPKPPRGGFMEPTPELLAQLEREDLEQARRMTPEQRMLAGAELFDRSEEHTSELQSLRHLVCRLLLAKKNTGVTLVKGYDSERDARMEPGDTTEMGGYTFRLFSVRGVQRTSYLGASAQTPVNTNRRAG